MAVVRAIDPLLPCRGYPAETDFMLFAQDPGHEDTQAHTDT